MRSWRHLGLLVSLASATFAPAAAAQKGYSGCELGLGEALGPQLLRLTIRDFDVTASSIYFGAGQRFWSKHFYAGGGLGVHSSLGFYGMMGLTTNPFANISLALEVTGFGDFSGQVRGQSFVNLGVIF